MLEGARDGFAVGVTVGAMVGRTVGVMDGDDVGVAVGVCVGLSEGWFVIDEDTLLAAEISSSDGSVDGV